MPRTGARSPARARAHAHAHAHAHPHTHARTHAHTHTHTHTRNNLFSYTVLFSSGQEGVAEQIHNTTRVGRQTDLPALVNPRCWGKIVWVKCALIKDATDEKSMSVRIAVFANTSLLRSTHFLYDFNVCFRLCVRRTLTEMIIDV